MRHGGRGVGGERGGRKKVERVFIFNCNETFGIKKLDYHTKILLNMILLPAQAINGNIPNNSWSIEPIFLRNLAFES